VRGGNNSNFGWRQCESGRATLATIWESRACEDRDQDQEERRKENADGRADGRLLGCWVGLVTRYWAAGGMVLLVQIRSHKHLRYGMEVVHSFAA
jgi:hypothetical protein